MDLLKSFDEGIHKYLHKRAIRNKETHRLILAEKSVQGEVNVAVWAYGVELEQFNDHLYGF